MQWGERKLNARTTTWVKRMFLNSIRGVALLYYCVVFGGCIVARAEYTEMGKTLSN